MKILINAEFFGFGPAAAMVHLFHYLRPYYNKIGFIGRGHVLDLHRSLPYDEIIDIEKDFGISRGNIHKDFVSDSEKRKKLFEFCKGYDLFITAMDFYAASLAKEIGLKLIIYDQLTWFWDSVPEIVAKADLYLSQNFFGVEDRIRSNPSIFRTARVVPPIPVCLKSESNGEKEGLFVNFGGLSNPLTRDESFSLFIDFICRGVNSGLSAHFKQISIAASNSFAYKLPNRYGVKINTLSPKDTLQQIDRSKLSIMTLGLGNIFEAASLSKSVLWLPPTNVSQGRQLRVLLNNGIKLLYIDWHELLDVEPIDYLAPHDLVLEQISHCLEMIGHDSSASKRLTAILNRLYGLSLDAGYESNLPQLFMYFGQDGMKSVFHEIVIWTENYLKKNGKIP